MSHVRIIIKAIKVKIALNRLSRLKENAVRLHMGLPPKKNWCEECYIGFMSSVRTACCEIFTPCCIMGRLQRRMVPNTCRERIFFPGTYENEVFKNILGFIIGIIVTLGLYLVMVLQLKYAPLTSSLVCSGIGFICTIGLAFSGNTRLMVCLMMPQFFTSKGRTFLLMYAVILVMNHPVQNFNKNVLVMSESATCGQELAFNQTRELVEAAMSPVAAIVNTIKKLMDALLAFAAAIRKAFMALKTAIEEIAGAMSRVIKWLLNIVNICNEKMGEPYQKCKRAFDSGEQRCRDALSIMGFVCEIVNVISNVCYICRITELLCIIASAIKNLVIDHIVSPIKSAIFDIYKMFYFNVTITYNYSFNMSQSKSYSAVKKEILKEIQDRLSGFTDMVNVISNVLVITILFVFIRAVIYRQKYLNNDRFDNFYITYKIEEIDERRQQMGKESIFPLSSRERGKYTKTSSIRMVKSEKKKIAKGVIVLFIAGCHAGFYILSDYSLWWLLSMMNKHLRLKTGQLVPPHLKMHVQGKGALADMYKALISVFDPVAESGVALDTSTCLPDPYEPEWIIYNEIGLIFGLCLFLVLFESYGLRLRHVICGCYFPKREEQRGVWLYNHIIKNRGGFLKFERRSMRKKHRTIAPEKGSIKGKLAARFRLCEKLFKCLGWERKFCLCCSREGRKEDMENFVHCAQGDCQAVYCYECYDELNNLCTLCMSPIDYGDLSDLSEERDSSEDEGEYLRKREAARLQKEQREQERLENSPSKRLAQLGFLNPMAQTNTRYQEESDESSEES